MTGQATAYSEVATARQAVLRVAEPTPGAGWTEPSVSRYSPRTSDEQRVLDALAMVVDPCSIATGAPLSIHDMGLVREIEVTPGAATIRLRLTSPVCFQIGLICEAIEKRVQALDLACVIEVDPVDPWSTDLMSDDARERLKRQREMQASRWLQAVGPRKY